MNVLTQQLRRINSIFMKLIKWISIAAFAVMLAAASLQIVMRFVFQTPLAWTDEVARYCFIWSTMLGCAYLVQKGGHSSVELLGNALTGQAKCFHGILVDLLCLFFYAVVIKGGITLVQAGATSNSVACSIPMALVYLIVPLSGVLMFLFQFQVLLEKMIRKESDS